MLLSTALVTLLIPLAPQEPAPPAAGRAAVRPLAELLAPDLERCLVEVLTVESELVRLTSPYDEDGRPLPREVVDQRYQDPESELVVFVKAQAERFDQHGKALELAELYDSVLFDAGYRAARRLVDGRASRPNADLPCDELLAIFDPAFVDGEPLWSTTQAQFFHKESLRTGELWPLGNGRALAHLTWGLLRLDDYWQDERHDREAFLAGLLHRGFESRSLSQVVTRALTPPRVRSAGSKPGRGIAGHRQALREKVGFTTAHEDALEQDLLLVQDLRNLRGSSGELSVEPVLFERLGGAQLTITPARLGHLSWWLPSMLEQVRSELYPDGVALSLRRGATPEERLYFWSRFFAEQGFHTGRAWALREIEAMLAWEDDWPGLERIAELEALATAGPLGAEQRAELERLQHELDQGRDLVVTRLVDLMARTGAHEDLDLLVATLLEDLPGALAGMQAEHQLGFLERGWQMLAIEPQPRTNGLLEDVLDESLAVPDYARESLIWSAAFHDYDDSSALLGRILETGTALDRNSALLNSDWLPSQEYEDSLAAQLRPAALEGLGPEERSKVQSGLLASLRQREDPAIAKRVFVQSLSAPGWSSSEDGAFWNRIWSSAGSSSVDVRWALSLLSSSELEALVEEGKLPESLL